MLLPLAQNLISKGFDIVVVVLGQSTFEPKLWSDSGIRVFFSNGDDKTPLHTSRDAFYVVKELRSIIRIVEPDIIHAWCGPSLWLTLLSIQNPPLIQRLPRFRLLATESTIPTQQPFFREWLEARFSSQIERLIVPHISVDEALREMGCEAAAVSIVPNAAVTSSFSPGLEIAMSDRGSQRRLTMRSEVRERLGLPEDAKLAIAIADLVPKSRLKDLIWATDLLACIRDDFHFAMIGVGPQKTRLQKFTAQTEARPHVHFLGLAESPESILASADFYWHAHLQAPTPAPLLSAMSMGIAAVSVWGPGTSDIIRHQETGFATNFGARDEFARWTKYLIEQADSATQLAQQGQDFVNTEFAFEKVVDAYLDIYEG